MKEHCKEVLKQAYLFLDGEVLSESERVHIELHLEECAPCMERMGFEREFVFALHRVRSATPCPEGLRSRISRFLEEA